MFPQVVYVPNRTRFIISFTGISLASYPEFYFDGRSFTNGSEKIEVTGTIRNVASYLQEHLNSWRSLFHTDGDSFAYYGLMSSTLWDFPTSQSVEELTDAVERQFSISRGLDVIYLPPNTSLSDLEPKESE